MTDRADNRDPGEDPRAALDATARYYSAAIDLRNASFFNLKDYDFAFRKHGEIRYVFDSNVVWFYLNPVVEKRKVDPFVTSEGPYAALSIITAEFLMNARLSGQFGNPPLISPEHYREFGSRMAEFADVDADAVGTEVSERLAEEVRRIVRTAEEARPVASAVDRLARADAKIRELLNEETYTARMFARLHKENLVNPLFLDEYADEEVVQPDRAEVDRWRRLIAGAREAERRTMARARGGRPADEAPHDERDEADALTAARVVQLNRNAAADTECPQPVRYVLVTDNRSYYNAAVEWWRGGGSKDLEIFPFRRLSQYIPLLNTDQMPNGTEDSELLAGLVAALDMLPGLRAGRETDFPQVIPNPALGAEDASVADAVLAVLERLSGVGVVDSSRREAQKHWQNLSESSAYMNASLLSRRIGAFGPLARYLTSSRSARKAVLDYMRRTIDDVEEAHVAFDVAHTLSSELRSRPSAGGDSAPVRAMLVIRETFEDIIGSRPLYPFLDDFTRNARREELEAIAGRLIGQKRYLAHFFTGCVRFWGGHWRSASTSAARALARFDRTGGDDRVVRAELAYFRALTERFAASDAPAALDGLAAEQKFERVVQQMRQLEPVMREMSRAAEQSGDPLSRVRARLEEGLWRLSISYALGAAGGARAEAALSECLAADRILAGLEDEAAALSDMIGGEVGAMLEAELCAATAACLVQKAGAGQPVDLDGAEAQAARMRALLDAHPGIVPRFYELTIDFLRQIGASTWEERRAVAGAIRERIESVEARGDHTTWLDDALMARFHAELAEVGKGRMSA